LSERKNPSKFRGENNLTAVPLVTFDDDSGNGNIEVRYEDRTEKGKQDIENEEEEEEDAWA
jgi:hypothetical protein